MEIGYSVETLLNAIGKQAQEIASEGRWIEYYTRCEQNEQQIADLENAVFWIEEAVAEIKNNIEYLKSVTM